MLSPKRIRQIKIVYAVIATLVIIKLTSYTYYTIKKVEEGPQNKDYELNEAINARNTALAKANPYGFTDRVHNTAKPKGVFRLAVIGDSFIWGDGLPYEQAWSHKLERKLLMKYDSLEVFHCGQCGWSTLDEINWFKRYGIQYNMDLLVFGWVDNDPDLGNWAAGTFINPAEEYPWLYKIFPGIAKGWCNKRENDLYSHFMDTIYSAQNIANYAQLLSNFKAYTDSIKLKTVFVLTSGAGVNDEQTRRLDSMKVMIEHSGFDCLNLCPAVREKFKGYTEEQLRANPANGHPGTLITEVFADETMAYLVGNGYLAPVPLLANRK